MIHVDPFTTLRDRQRALESDGLHTIAGSTILAARIAPCARKTGTRDLVTWNRGDTVRLG